MKSFLQPLGIAPYYDDFIIDVILPLYEHNAHHCLACGEVSPESFIDCLWCIKRYI